MAQVVHVEIHASQPETLLAFYTQLFGWQAQQVPGMPYWMLHAGDGHGPTLALLQRPGGPAAVGAAVNGFICTIEVADVHATMARALAMGAQEALPIQHYPGMGHVGYMLDPDHNVVGLKQPEAGH